MIERIHVDSRLKKNLAALRKGSRRACLAAERTEAIIEGLKHGRTPPGAICAFTRNGEARIKGCRKFNLGAGYRLVTLKRENDLYLLFAGTHDACSRWIANNYEQLTPDCIAERSDTIRRPGSRKETSPTGSKPPPAADADEDWIPALSDQDLRAIFSGLVDGR